MCTHVGGCSSSGRRLCVYVSFSGVLRYGYDLSASSRSSSSSPLMMFSATAARRGIIFVVFCAFNTHRWDIIKKLHDSDTSFYFIFAHREWLFYKAIVHEECQKLRKKRRGGGELIPQSRPLIPFWARLVYHAWHYTTLKLLQYSKNQSESM